MALVKADAQGNSMEADFKQDFKKLKLIATNIKPLNNALYQGVDIFYLTDESNNYLGHIEYDYLDETKIRIRSSYSTQRGFYELMFKFILIKTEVKMIFGDDEQSNRSTTSWKKMLQKYVSIVYNTETKKTENYDVSKESEYWVKQRGNHKKYLIGLSEHNNYFTDCYKNIENLMEMRESKNRVSDMKMDYLVRHFDIDEMDAQEIIINK